jgi:hypothetical protein
MIDTYSRATARAAKAVQAALQLAEDIKHAMQHLPAGSMETQRRLTAYLADQPARERQMQHVSELLGCAIRMMEEEAPTAHQRAVIAAARNGHSREASDAPIDLEAAELWKERLTFATCIAEVNVLCSILEHRNREAQVVLNEIAPALWRDSSSL